jgi:hypothetical protein
MATPLHDADALTSIATGEPGAAADWAASRLALVEPTRFTVFPGHADTHDVVIAADPDGLLEALTAALRVPTEPLAQAVLLLGEYGVMPQDLGALHYAIVEGIKGDGSPADLWLVHALALRGEATADHLVAAAASQSIDRNWLLPAVVLRVAQRAGALGEVAEQMGEQLELLDPTQFAAMLHALGLPPIGQAVGVREPEAIVQLGARWAGGDVPDITRPRGSRRNRFKAWVRDLSGDRHGPAAALLFAIDLDKLGPEQVRLCAAAAAWLSVYSESDPVVDVLERGGGVDPWRLSAARRGITDEHVASLAKAIGRTTDPAVWSLALALSDQPGLDQQLVARTGIAPGLSPQAIAVAAVAGWRAPAAVVALLQHPGTRVVGLELAAWNPSLEVLQALLEMPVPADHRREYAWALAAMGDQATLPLLGDLFKLDDDEELGQARQLVTALFGHH